VEHPIPESLGNDDLTLSVGVVCDACNQYFGAKLESRVLAAPPFGVERVGQAIRTKRGRLPKYEEEGLVLVSTGFWDRVLVVAPDPSDCSKARRVLSDRIVYTTAPPGHEDLLARFLLKVGLELATLGNGVDLYGSAFDSARRCARFGELATRWDIAYGRHPGRQELKISSRVDEFGPLETRQIYQYEIGIMPSGDLVFCFVFVNHVFACNLSRPSITEYLLGFNARNRVSLRSRWH
jgi:hypothetical protein